MPVIVFDDFTRPDNPSSLGTATTGQVWVPYGPNWEPADTHWEIHSNQGARFAGEGSDNGGGFALVESGINDCIVKVTINNVDFGGDLNNANYGLIFRWESTINYWMATWSRSGKFLRICQVDNGNFICTSEGFPGASQLTNGDVIEVRCCGDEVKGYINGVLKVTTAGVLGPPNGTMHGLQCGTGVIQDEEYSLYDDFTVETNNECEGANWIIPALTWTAEGIVESDTPTGGVRTLRFDAGSGSQYYYVAPVTDSSNELTTKTIKSVRATGRLTNAVAKIWRYDVEEGINLDDLEDGTNSTTGAIPIPDSTLVAQSAQLNTNVTNCALSTVRIEGDDREQDVRDELHEVVLQVADAGVRR